MAKTLLGLALSFTTAAGISCMAGTAIAPRFDNRPAEWLEIRGDDRPWKLLAVEDEPDHYAESIALGGLPTLTDSPLVSEAPVLGDLPVDSVATRKPLLWEFRVERRLVYRGSSKEPVAEATAELREELELGCSALTWKPLYETPGDAMYEWQHDGCSGGDPEHEILRLLEGRLGVHRASLRARRQRIPVEMRTEWIKILSQARLTGDRASRR